MSGSGGSSFPVQTTTSKFSKSDATKNEKSNVKIGSKILNDTLEISNNADIINNRVKNNFTNFITTGNYLLSAQTGNVLIKSSNTSATAFKLDTSLNDGGVLVKSGTQGMVLNTTGNLNLESSGNMNMGNSSNTSNLYLNSSTNLNLGSNDILIAASDDLSLTSTSGGSIIMDVNGNNVSNALKINNDGNILINKNSTDNDYQTEVNVATPSTKYGNINGLIVNSSNASITPDLKVKYQNSAGSKTVINSLGVYSETNTDAKYRDYVGYQ